VHQRTSKGFYLLLTSAVPSQATAVIPGSHLWGPDRAPKVEECTYAEMEPGSALFTLGCELPS
jgi:ectoine hydroxylase-related dioxygenase (phytanoyl-CoA dioxygenase family)